jgi:hypothetical protein
MAFKKVFLILFYLGFVRTGSTTVVPSSATGAVTLGITVFFFVASVTLSSVQEYKEKLTKANKKSWVKNFGFIKNHF